MVQSLLHVIDQKTANTSGGTPSAGANTRNLNTVLTNEITGASLASDQITLANGTYEIFASAPCYRGDEHRASLHNVTDASIEVVGANNYARNSGTESQGFQHQNKSFVRGRFTVSGGPKVFELRHEITATGGGTQGLGVESNDGRVEKYTDVQIREIVDDFDLLHIRDEKTANTDGGTSAAAAFQVRDLSPVKTNEITGASLSANVITLPIGTFEIVTACCAWDVTRNRIGLWNKDDSFFIVLGENQFTRGTLDHGNLAFMQGQFIILIETDFEIHHFTTSAVTNTGLGRKMNDGSVEIYTEVLIKKVI